MKKIALIGASDFAELLIHHILVEDKKIVYGIYDDYKDLGNVINGISVKGRLENISQDFKLGKFDYLLVAVGYSRMDYRASVFNEFKGIIPFANFIHSSCIIDPSVVLGEGVCLFPGTILDRNVIIKDNILLNLGVILSHDSIVHSHSFIAPGANIAGFCSIGEKCFIGINATFVDGVSICNNITIGAGAVLTKNLVELGVYTGIPAKKV